MLKRSLSLNRAFGVIKSNQDGMAATEFALLFPVMVILFFGVLEIADAMTFNRKVATAANTMVDIAAQTTDLTPNQIDRLVDSITTILAPADTSTLNVKLTSVVVDPDGEFQVHWSKEWENDAILDADPYPPGEEYTVLSADFRNNAQAQQRLAPRSLLVVEMDFFYTPTFAGRFLSDPLRFQLNSKRVPRQVPVVLLCDNNGTNCG